jgi:hypothetical protein
MIKHMGFSGQDMFHPGFGFIFLQENLEMLHKKNTTHLYWVVVWNISIILPYIGNSYPNLLNFSEGLKPPTS